MLEVKKTAGFWIRFLTRVIDTTLPIVIGLALAVPMVVKHVHYDFKFPVLFYVWCLILISLLLTSFIFIPWLTKGKTIGMFVTRTEIQFKEKNILMSMIKRETLMGLVWVFITALTMVVVNHTLIGSFARNNQKSITYTSFEKIRISLVSTVSAFLLLGQVLCALGVIVKSNHQGFHDKVSNTSTVWSNKVTVVKQKENIVTVAPRQVHNELVEWVK